VARRIAGVVGAAALVGAGAAGAAADVSGPLRTARDMPMVGNPHEFPDLAAAGEANVRRARRLLRASRRTAARFDTLAEAGRLGYVASPEIRPGFVPARKHGSRFWGRKFDAAAPQALVFWCPSRGPCTLTTYMYRAPAGRPPSTWGDMLMWHRHGTTATASWMTHVWLLRGVHDGFATCANWPALERELRIRRERYRRHSTDRPCTGEDVMPDDDRAPMPGM
jgi:hypothetical protein